VISAIFVSFCLTCGIFWNLNSKILELQQNQPPSETELQRRIDRLDIDLTDLSDKVKKFINRERTRAAREAKEEQIQTPVNDNIVTKDDLWRKVSGRA